MALFKESLCAHCGKKAGMLTRIKLEDGRYICAKCQFKLPDEISQELTGRSYDEFLAVYNYMTEVSPVLGKRFRETHKFHGIHLDTAHDLFWLDGMNPTAYLRLRDIHEFDLQFVADEVKDGFFSTKVTGKLYLKLRMDDMLLFIDKVIASDVKAPAKISGVMSKKVTYENPKGMDEFFHHFNSARVHDLDQEIMEINKEIQALNAAADDEDLDD